MSEQSSISARVRPALAEPLFDVGMHDVGEVARRVEKVRQQAVGDLAGQLQHRRLHGGEVDRRRLAGRGEHAAIVADRDDLALVLDRRCGTGGPHQPDRLDVLPHAPHRPAVGEAVPVLVPRRRRGAEAEHEAPLRQLGHRHGADLGQRRRPCEDRDAGAEARALAGSGHAGERHEGIAAELRSPEAFRARILGLGRKVDGLLQRQIVAAEEHGPFPLAAHPLYLRSAQLGAEPGGRALVHGTVGGNDDAVVAARPLRREIAVGDIGCD